MQYTGKGNQLLWYVVIPLLIITYLSFRTFAWISASTAPDNGRKSIIDAHINHLSQSEYLNCLVLGGSNAFFSLSAELLGKQINANCYNIALLNEGFSPENYWGFIDDALSETQKTEIKTIVYSSITPLRKGEYQRRISTELEITGNELDFELYGKKSMGSVIASNLKNWLKNSPRDTGITYPLPNFFGDFDFNNFKCDFKEIKSKFDRETDHNILQRWTHERLDEIHTIFPNAQIYFVIPSEYYDGDYNQTLANRTYVAIEESIRNFKHRNPNFHISLIVQPRFTNKDILCDDKHHANQAGRRLRTTNLSSMINPTKLNDN